MPIAGATESDVPGRDRSVLRVTNRSADCTFQWRRPNKGLELWLTERAGRKVRIVVLRSAAEKGLVDPRTAAELAYQRRFNQAAAAQYGRSTPFKRYRPANAPAPHQCFDISTIRGAKPLRRWSCAKTDA